MQFPLNYIRNTGGRLYTIEIKYQKYQRRHVVQGLYALVEIIYLPIYIAFVESTNGSSNFEYSSGKQIDYRTIDQSKS